MKSSRRSTQRRFGIAMLELIMCIPAFGVLILSSVESCTKLNVREALHASAAEAVQVAVTQGATNRDVLERCNDLLVQHNIESASVAIVRSGNRGDVNVSAVDVSTVESGCPITVRIVAPMRENSLMKCRFFTSQIECQVTMVKE